MQGIVDDHAVGSTRCRLPWVDDNQVMSGKARRAGRSSMRMYHAVSC